MDFSILITEQEEEYMLLDSGDGEKLEQYGPYKVSRPDPQALWKKKLPQADWEKAHAIFLRTNEKAGWKLDPSLPERWSINLAGLQLWIRPTSFKHTGLFPEQVSNWKWIGETLKRAEVRGRATSSVLNLFGYTGGATLAASQAGADVVHVDGSKVALTWARENAELSGLKDKPIRWILDDIRAFVRREIKRGNKYDGIIMDPPAFGHGPKKELWRIEEHFLEFLDECKQLLKENPLFFVVNGYASGYSALTYKNNLQELLKEYNGSLEVGELTIREKSGNRLLPSGIFARWNVTELIKQP